MPKHQQTSTSPYTSEQLFTLVADVDSYAEFLPWCVASRVTERHDDHLLADLVIGFKAFRSKYTSRVNLSPHQAIHVEMVEGPFTHLTNIWEFTPLENGGTRIDFTLDFRFKSSTMEALIGKLFLDATKKMMSAFEKRADELYN